MKKIRSFVCIPLFFFLLGACQEDETRQVSNGSTIVGTWLLYEYGYSPGSGYFVEAVPSVPPQTITFTADGEVKSNLEQSNIHYYRWVTSASEKDGRIAWAATRDALDSAITVSVSIKNDTLLLNPPCIEGCHQAYVRVHSQLPRK